MRPIFLIIKYHILFFLMNCIAIIYINFSQVFYENWIDDDWIGDDWINDDWMDELIIDKVLITKLTLCKFNALCLSL